MPFLTAGAERLVEALDLLALDRAAVVRAVLFARVALLAAAGRVLALFADVDWAVAIWEGIS